MLFILWEKGLEMKISIFQLSCQNCDSLTCQRTLISLFFVPLDVFENYSAFDYWGIGFSWITTSHVSVQTPVTSNNLWMYCWSSYSLFQTCAFHFASLVVAFCSSLCWILLCRFQIISPVSWDHVDLLSCQESLWFTPCSCFFGKSGKH